jgi:hypothetical protein
VQLAGPLLLGPGIRAPVENRLSRAFTMFFSRKFTACVTANWRSLVVAIEPTRIEQVFPPIRGHSECAFALHRRDGMLQPPVEDLWEVTTCNTKTP